MKKLVPYLILTLIAFVIYPPFRRLEPVTVKTVRFRLPADSTHVDGFNQQCQRVWNTSLRQAALYNKEAFKLTAKLGDQKGQAEAYRCLGVILLKKGDTQQALPYLNYALLRYRQLDDQAGQAATLNNLGAYYVQYRNYDGAKRMLDQALQLYKRLDDQPGLSGLMLQFGDLVYHQHNYSSALSYYKQALTLDQNIHTRFNSALALGRIGHLYLYTGQRTIALSYFQKALQLASRQRDNFVLADASLGMGMVYQRQNRLPQAIAAYQRSARAEEAFRGHKSPWHYQQIADLYKAQRQYPKALSYYQQSLKVQQDLYGQKDSFLSVEIYQQMADLYEQQGKYETALANLQAAIKLIRGGNAYWIEARSLPIYNRIGQVYLTWGKYSLALQHAQLGLQGAQQKGDRELVQDAHLILSRIYAARGDSAQAYRHHLQYTSFREARQTEEIDRVAFLKNDLAMHQKEHEVNLLWQESQQQNEVMKSMEQRNYALLVALALFIALVFVLIRQNRRNQRTAHLLAEQASQLEAQRIRELEQTFEYRQAESEMAALRAQMNPHFIFNCLNSIKLYASDNEAAKASSYLTKFARLIRLVLENSRSERVSLQNELEALQLYCDMEIMRFKDKLTCQLSVDESIDQEFVEIPPLLVQPFVENAIWHGLMHKENGGTVWVHVEQPQADQLQITITDNGVGRAQAARLASKSAAKRKSYGVQMTHERLELINQVYKTNTTVRIDDLMSDEKQPIGTRVVLQIPL